MSESRNPEADSIAAARSRWLVSSEQASKLSADLFQPGSGYGDPDARLADEHRLRSAKEDAECLFREYFDLDRQRIDSEMLKLQRSQRLATWASFAVAAVVGAATVVVWYSRCSSKKIQVTHAASWRNARFEPLHDSELES